MTAPSHNRPSSSSKRESHTSWTNWSDPTGVPKILIPSEFHTLGPQSSVRGGRVAPLFHVLVFPPCKRMPTRDNFSPKRLYNSRNLSGLATTRHRPRTRTTVRPRHACLHFCQGVMNREAEQHPCSPPSCRVCLAGLHLRRSTCNTSVDHTWHGQTEADLGDPGTRKSFPIMALRWT